MTVAANDITGRNDAPEFLRITAQWMRVKDSGAQAVKPPAAHKRGQHGRAYKWSTYWAEIGGEIVPMTMGELAKYLESTVGSMGRYRAWAQRAGKHEAVIKGKRWGWLDENGGRV